MGECHCPNSGYCNRYPGVLVWAPPQAESEQGLIRVLAVYWEGEENTSRGVRKGDLEGRCVLKLVTTVGDRIFIPLETLGVSIERILPGK